MNMNVQAHQHRGLDAHFHTKYTKICIKKRNDIKFNTDVIDSYAIFCQQSTI